MICQVEFVRPPRELTQEERDAIADRLDTLSRFVRDARSPEAQCTGHLYGYDERGRPYAYLVEGDFPEWLKSR